MLIVATAQRFGGTGLGLAITRNRRALLTSPLDKSDREHLNDRSCYCVPAMPASSTTLLQRTISESMKRC